MDTTEATATLPRSVRGGEEASAHAAIDLAQQAAIRAGGRVRRVLGAPGTGKTTVAVGIVVHRVRDGGVHPDRCLLVGPTRTAAGRLRTRLTAELGATTTRPLARTLQSFAFGLLVRDARRRGEPTPRLLTGAEQDVVLADLLAGHAAGTAPGPAWPESLALALPTRGFRSELRDLLMRAVELGLEPADLAALGRTQARPEWEAAARLLAEYDEVGALAFPGAYDPAWVLRCAADLLTDDDIAAQEVAGELEVVVVDDAQELTRAALRLLARLSGLGVDIVLVGDPDVTTGTFRGADPAVLGRDWHELGDGPTHVLDVDHRCGRALRRAVRRITAQIGSAGAVTHRAPLLDGVTAPSVAEDIREPAGDGGETVPERSAQGGEGSTRGGEGGAGAGSPSEAEPGRPATEPDEGPGPEVLVAPGPGAEAALVAERLRRAHLLGGTPWSDMAVVVRSGGELFRLRRVLQTRGVPVQGVGADVALRDELAVAPLLTLLGVLLDEARGVPAPTQVLRDVLAAPLLGLDSLMLRRVRRALRRAERSRGGDRGGDDLLVAALVEPELLEAADLGREGEPLRRVVRMLDAGRAVLRRATDRDRTTDPAELLWAMWDASGVAEQWRRSALEGGSRGTAADRDLDAVMALFDAATAYTDRLPGRGPSGFLEHVASLAVAADSLSRGVVRREAVTLATVSGVAGREFDVVAVCGVQDGVWPDLRVRGSVLGSSALLDVVTGRSEDEQGAREAVRADETRLFLVACSRARRHLFVTAVADEESQPSPLCDLVVPADAHDVTEAGAPLTLAGVVGVLRRRLVLDPDPAARAHAADRLATLAAAGVAGADPDTWWELRDVSDRRPVRDPGAAVAVSPSRVETFGRCGLRWLLSGSGGDDARRGDAANVGTLVHDIAATVDNADEEAMVAALHERVDELGSRTGWLARRRLESARAMLGRLAAYDRAARRDGWEVVGRELDARADVGRASLTGRVDRLERRAEDGALRVVDLKTGSTKPTGAEMARQPQLGTYQAAVEAGAFAEDGTTSAGAALVQLGRAAGVRPSVQEQAAVGDDPDDPGWARRLVEEAADGMAAETFTARAGSWCRVCPVRASCPVQVEGRRV